MLIVQVDVVHPEPLQRSVATLPDVSRVAAHAPEGAVLAAHVAELRRELHVVSPARYGLADELLVRERPVHVRRVDKGDAEVDGPLDRRDRFTLVARTVELAHPHAPEPQGRDHEPIAPQVALLQGTLPTSPNDPGKST